MTTPETKTAASPRLSVRAEPDRYALHDGNGHVYAEAWHIDIANELVLAVNEHKGLVEALRELVDIVEGFRAGETKIDSFTTQPARSILARLDAARDVLAVNEHEALVAVARRFAECHRDTCAIELSPSGGYECSCGCSDARSILARLDAAREGER